MRNHTASYGTDDAGSRLKVAVLHNALQADASAADEDVLVQVEAVAAALVELGHEAVRWECTLDLSRLREQLREWRPHAVFNLVESLGGTDRLTVLPPLLLESLGVPFTGAGSAAMLADGSKLIAKERLAAHGLPTPLWRTLAGGSSMQTCRRVIIKPIWEHGSVGMDDASVLDSAADAAIDAGLRDRETLTGRPHFAEEFIEGREFNLSLLAQVLLPPAEIQFLGFPPDKPRIVGYPAKWEAESFEYQQTPRRFDFADADAPLLDELARLARRCWDVFGLRGYARVDFRVDEAGRPWILEVNVNPCLSPDAGFAAALEQAGIPFPDAIRRIVEDAFATGCGVAS